MKTDILKEKIRSEQCRELFASLYGKNQYDAEVERYDRVIDGFAEAFGADDSGENVLFFSSPGRSEISGNHTDHNHGKVIGGSINMDCICAAAVNRSRTVNLISETYHQNFTVDLDSLEPGKEKTGTAELVKGILKGFVNKGYAVGGFNAYITSNVLPGAGVSSSASFETLVCQMINTFFNNETIDTVEYAHIGQFAENRYWDKASGLLDQMCCAVGGLISVDFKNPENPRVKKIHFDFKSSGHSLIIVNTGKGHADLSADYSAIPEEMRAVAGFFGKQYLSEITEEDVLSHILEIRKQTGDRAVMRALHFFEENRRVDLEEAALEAGDFDAFLRNVTASGNSSWKYLQNCYTVENYKEQGICITLALTELFLSKKGCGACRVHGGGFAGVIMAIVPDGIAEEYISYIDRLTGGGNAYRMFIRPEGSLCISRKIALALCKRK